MLTINCLLATETFFDQLEKRLKYKDAPIWEEDLLNLIFLCEDNVREVSLLMRAIEAKSVSFFAFDYGPTVMRMAHHLNLPEVALKLPEMVGSFLLLV